MFDIGKKVVILATEKVGVVYKRENGAAPGITVYYVMTDFLTCEVHYEDEMVAYDYEIPLASDTQDSEIAEGTA